VAAVVQGETFPQESRARFRIASHSHDLSWTLDHISRISVVENEWNDAMCLLLESLDMRREGNVTFGITY
jgi:hypothetical protein